MPLLTMQEIVDLVRLANNRSLGCLFHDEYKGKSMRVEVIDGACFNAVSNLSRRDEIMARMISAR